MEVFTLPVPKNNYGLSGPGMDFYAYFKPEGAISEAGNDTRYSLLLLAPYTYCEELSDQVDLANVYLSQVKLSVLPQRISAFLRFYVSPAGGGVLVNRIQYFLSYQLLYPFWAFLKMPQGMLV